MRNDSAGVCVEVEGAPERLQEFSTRLRDELPPLAQIDSVCEAELPLLEESTFCILPSTDAVEARTSVSPDIATCDFCLRELRDPDNRRYRYPFINCTDCGPRYTILRDIPYDRPQTTMSVFPMCRQCEAEYHDPTNRRYHAQANACPQCGPAVWFVNGNCGEQAAWEQVGATTGEAACAAFRGAIANGQIVAVKGIGGFHLACDATNSSAVANLRKRKGRNDKPLAVMVADVTSARRLAEVDDDEARLLMSRQRPIVLLRRREAANLSPLIAPGNDTIGILLPYSPLHVLLVEGQALVMTSGNRSEEPIARTNREASSRLNHLADAFLLHDREIHVVCDDSVVRIARGQHLPIRRSRGHAPLPVRLACPVPSCLAVGGELKTTFCLTKDEHAWMSPHLGDMGNLETLAAFGRAVDHFLRLFRVTPEVVACDRHPGYLSSQWARDYARRNRLPLVEVQHHHAHLAGALAEHGRDATAEAIGICFDGTGYGDDQAIWGGEAMLASWSGARRLAHLKYVPLPGGDAAIREPARAALAHLWAAGIEWDPRLASTQYFSSSSLKILRQQLDRGVACAATSSMGRLFDAVASLAGIRQQATYEAQAALEMEALAEDIEAAEPYPMGWSSGVPLEIDPAAMFRALVADLIAGAKAPVVAARFHRTIIELIAQLCIRTCDSTGGETVVLSGGVFQNRRLVEGACQRLNEEGFEVLIHRTVPPNDGGLALGQAVVAATELGYDASLSSHTKNR